MSEINIDTNETEKEEFEKNVLLLQAFTSQHHRLLTQEDDPQLHTWMMSQMEKRRISYTPRKKEIRITRIGGNWMRQEEEWFSKLRFVKEFIAQNNALPGDGGDYALNAWLKAQLASLDSGMNLPSEKKKQLSALREDIRNRKLNLINREYYFTPADLPSLQSELYSTSSKFNRPICQKAAANKDNGSSIEKTWLLMLVRVVIFKEQEGRWPQYISFDTDERPLAIWCNKMKFKYKEGTLSNACINYLQGIRFPFL